MRSCCELGLPLARQLRYPRRVARGTTADGWVFSLRWSVVRGPLLQYADELSSVGRIEEGVLSCYSTICHVVVAAAIVDPQWFCHTSAPETWWPGAAGRYSCERPYTIEGWGVSTDNAD